MSVMQYVYLSASFFMTSDSGNLQHLRAEFFGLEKILFHYHRGIVHKKQSLCKNHFTMTKNIIICMKLYRSYDHSVHEKLHCHALNNI